MGIVEWFTMDLSDLPGEMHRGLHKEVTINFMAGVRKQKMKATFDVPDEKLFFVQNGSALRNLRDLERALGEMSENQYGFHTAEHGNDFARWIEEVFLEKALANRVRKAANQTQAAESVKKYLL